jgi:DNA-binding beta-propeller fold protein YncE
MSRLFIGALLLGALVPCVQADDPPQFILKWGSLGSGPGEFNSPRGIAVASNGTLYVVDTNNNRIQHFDGHDTFLSSWGSFCDLSTGNGCIGDGSGQFYLPWGIAISGRCASVS